MRAPLFRSLLPLLAVGLVAPALGSHAVAQDPEHATEFRMQQPGVGPDGKPPVRFLTHRLGTDHSEGISMLDMNGDGYVDLLSGSYWYENPGATGGGDWKQHQFRTVGIHNEFVSDCGEWIIDVDHDGLPDVVTTGWISNGLFWYKNPGPKATASGQMWKAEKITDTYDTEGGAFADIDGDGHPDLALAHYDHSGVLWVSFGSGKPVVHKLGGSEEDGHGIGIGDVNGDGKADILTPHGWFEQIDARNDKWTWHGDWSLADAGFPILTYDVNHDGKPDVIFGQGHAYGLYWLEQAGTTASPRWIRHTIDESFSQSHSLLLADLDGDGKPELITGKRYRGHSGADPGSYDPVVLYAYRLPTDEQLAKLKAGGSTRNTPKPGMVLADAASDPQWERIGISVNGTASAGTQILAADFDKDGDLDLASAGKLGVHFIENLKVNNVSKQTREAQQPLNRQWPFPNEGKEVPQEDNPASKK